MEATPHQSIDPQAVATEFVPETWQRLREIASGLNLMRYPEKLDVTVATVASNTDPNQMKSASATGGGGPDLASSEPTGVEPPPIVPGVATQQEVEREAMLADSISELWLSQRTQSVSLRRSRLELNEVRTKLGECLYEYKQLLVVAGRDGKWSEFLRQANIPKTTADRYVEKWKQCQSTATNLPSGEITEPSTDTVVALVKKLKPQLVLKLTTPGSISLFLTELAAALKPLAADK